VDPISPENPLVFAFSPLVGTPLTTSAKFAVAAKSPLTDRFCDALSSSHFALNGKRTGYDALVVVGRCTRPSVVLIQNDSVALTPSEELWGQTISKANETLRTQWGPEYRFGVIGPAGETGVRYATISFDGRHAGRGGLGAVLGAKNIKAIGVAGERRAPLANPATVVALAKELSAKSLGPATAKYRELGTVANVLALNRLNALPTRNFQAGAFEGVDTLSAEHLAATRNTLRTSCAVCTIGCEHGFAPKGGKPVRLEYESLFAFGPMCGIQNPDLVLQAAQLCDELGMDTISAGGTIAFAMECAEKGLWDTEGLHFGHGRQLLELLPQIANKTTAFGRLLAEGSRRAADVIGGLAPRLAVHVKGMELPGYEPRAMQAMALGFAVGTRGADHNRSGAYEVDYRPTFDRTQADERTVEAAVETEDQATLWDSLILCKFLRGIFTDAYSESSTLLNAVTGWDTSAAELRHTVQAIHRMKWEFNVREGWTIAEDTLPERFLDEPLPAFQGLGATLPRERLERMVKRYHQIRGYLPGE
jgi:aldehyde:ferredoxin oxidoreductase